MATKRKRLGELLIDSGLISQEQLAEALEIQKQSGEKLGNIIVNQNYVSEPQIMEVLEFQLGIPFVDLNNTKIPSEAQRIIPYNLIRRHNVVPVKIEMNMLYVAMDDPLNFIAIEDLRMASSYEIVPMIASKEAINGTISKLYGTESADQAILEFKKESDASAGAMSQTLEVESYEVDSAPIVKLVYSTLELAVSQGASDIHIEPMEDEVKVRFRVDGRLQQSQNIPKEAQAAVSTRIKIMAGLDIAEKRIPQDGRFDFTANNKVLNVRVSVLPTVHGEKVVMRILDKTNFLLPKEKLGFTKSNLVKFDQLLQNPNGIILITGPTGSGKSTTLYTMLSELNQVSDNITTVEDPIEYQIDGLNQVQVNIKAGLTFPNALRSFLRQDPDIIMVGEIRDSETVDVAIRAAITGHLVLSTLHTNDAVSSISRLEDMGVEPYLIAVSLRGVISQRLVRRLCTRCAEPYRPEEYELQYLGLPTDGDYTFYKAVGCSQCNKTGYKGRIAVHEILLINNEMKDMISRSATVNEITKFAIEGGMSTLKDESVKLIKNGITSFNEAMQITYSQ